MVPKEFRREEEASSQNGGALKCIEVFPGKLMVLRRTDYDAALLQESVKIWLVLELPRLRMVPRGDSNTVRMATAEPCVR